MANPSNTGFRRLIRAMFFSAAGLRAAWIHEAAFRQECVIGAVLVPAAFVLGETAPEKALLAGSCFVVLAVELLNSAIEAAVDRVGTDHHLLAGRAKDCGSAAVFMSIVFLSLVWGLILWERFA